MCSRPMLTESSQSRKSVDCIIGTSGALPERRYYSAHLPLSADFNGVPARPRSSVEPHLKITEAAADLIGFPLDFVAIPSADSICENDSWRVSSLA